MGSPATASQHDQTLPSPSSNRHCDSGVRTCPIYASFCAPLTHGRPFQQSYEQNHSSMQRLSATRSTIFAYQTQPASQDDRAYIPPGSLTVLDHSVNPTFIIFWLPRILIGYRTTRVAFSRNHAGCHLSSRGPFGHNIIVVRGRIFGGLETHL